MKRLKTRLLANRRKDNCKRQPTRAAHVMMPALFAVSAAVAGCATQSQPAAPYSVDCLRTYNPACGNPIRYDPIRDGHGG